MLCVILHLQNCLEEKTQNFTRARQSSTRQVDVLCEARRCSSSYKCSAGNTYAELQTRTKQVWEADYVRLRQSSTRHSGRTVSNARRCSSSYKCSAGNTYAENCLVENACVILLFTSKDLQHCLEEKTQNFTRARQSSTRQVRCKRARNKCGKLELCSSNQVATNNFPFDVQQETPMQSCKRARNKCGKLTMS